MDGRRYARRVARCALSALLALLALEGLLRLWASCTGYERGITFDPELGWRALPGVRKTGRQWTGKLPATTNSRGWRDTEHAWEKPEGRRRMVVLGDSFTFGVGVDQGERFTERLAEDLPMGEVINLGMNAFGTDQELRVLELEGLRYQPDVVVLVAFLGNDLDDICFDRRGGWPCPHYRLVDGALRLDKPSETWDVRLRTSSYLGEFLFQGLDLVLPRARRVAAEAERVPLFVALVRRMAEVCAAARTHFLVVLAYSFRRHESGPDADERRARAELTAAAIAVLDTWELIAVPSRAEQPVMMSDGHWTPLGHRLVAEAIRSEILARGFWR